jgi:hypothetical protein
MFFNLFQKYDKFSRRHHQKLQISMPEANELKHVGKMYLTCKIAKSRRTRCHYPFFTAQSVHIPGTNYHVLHTSVTNFTKGKKSLRNVPGQKNQRFHATDKKK